MLLYTNIDQNRCNKLNGPVHYKIGVYWTNKHPTHVYSMTRYIHYVGITRPFNSPISQIIVPCYKFTNVWSMFPCNTFRPPYVYRAPRKHFSWTSPGPVTLENGQALIFFRQTRKLFFLQNLYISKFYW